MTLNAESLRRIFARLTLAALLGLQVVAAPASGAEHGLARILMEFFCDCGSCGTAVETAPPTAPVIGGQDCCAQPARASQAPAGPSAPACHGEAGCDCTHAPADTAPRQPLGLAGSGAAGGDRGALELVELTAAAQAQIALPQLVAVLPVAAGPPGPSPEGPLGTGTAPWRALRGGAPALLCAIGIARL